jgi:hypothetical protein
MANGDTWQGYTGQNLMGSLQAKEATGQAQWQQPAPGPTDEELWRQYMSGGGAKGEGTDTRHMDQLARTHAQQLAAAEAYYAGATAPSNIQAAQMRGGALQSSLGGLAGGGLAAREAIYGAGAGAYGAGASRAPKPAHRPV